MNGITVTEHFEMSSALALQPTTLCSSQTIFSHIQSKRSLPRLTFSKVVVKFNALGTSALATIPHLETIDLSVNTIETIEQQDLEGFRRIKTLVLSNMPLKYISRDSLRPLHSIKEITMNNTLLTEVPRALNFTTTLEKVNLGNDQYS
jgi:Leucine-rich repeat (LRR) protein